MTERSAPRKGEIVAAALALVREVGVDGLTMRGLCERLGVTAPVVYYYVKNKRALLELVADAVLESVELPGEADGDWAERLKLLVLRSRDTIGQYRGLAAYLVRDMPSGAEQVLSEYALELLMGVGFGPEEAVKAHTSFSLLLIGNLLAESLNGTGAGRRASASRSFNPSSPRATADMPALKQAQQHANDLTDRDYFEFAVDQLIEGLRSELAFREKMARLQARPSTAS